MKNRTAYVGSALLFFYTVLSGTGAAVAAVGPASAPAMTTSTTLPDLTVAANPGTAPFSLLPTCAPGKKAIVFHLMVSNIGAGPSAALIDVHAVWVQAIANPSWAGGSPIPAIAAHGAVAVDVQLNALAPRSAIWGHHVFRVTVNGAKTIAETSYANNSTTIAVDISRGFCNGVSFAGNPGTGVGPTPTPTRTPFSFPGAMLAPGASATPTPLPPPINLAQAITKDVCQAHGGSAGSFACYIGLPAGKLALVWDYPFSNPIDGYRVYPNAPAPSGPMTFQLASPVVPVASQSDPSFKFVVIDPPKPGSCFAVTAYRGSQESKFSVRYCVSAGGIPKMASLSPDRSGAMVQDYIYDPNKLRRDQDGHYNVRDLSYLAVGYAHAVSTWRDDAHTQVSTYMNSEFGGYVHFDSSALSGRHIAQAQLHLMVDKTEGPTNGQSCLAKWGGTDRLRSPGGEFSIGGIQGGSRIQGPEMRLDVTPLVQSWADSPTSNKGIGLEADNWPTDLDIMFGLSETCLTTFSSATLDVTYY